MNEKDILLVEDNPDDEQLAVRALKRNNIVNEIIVVRDGQEALEYLLDENIPLPALVLLDLKLPKVSGLEVLQKLRSVERTQILPVVVLTTSKEEQDLLGSYRFGCNSYIRKPVDFIQFTEAMRNLKIYWLMLNEPPPMNRGHQ
ncbi:MAG: response regulator [Chthoniobacterales bacterium]